LTLPLLASLASDVAMVVDVSSVAWERAAMDVIGCAFIRSWMSRHERAEAVHEETALGPDVSGRCDDLAEEADHVADVLLDERRVFQ
jgi:hypothetical protein